jgi:hypothetical protein
MCAHPVTKKSAARNCLSGGVFLVVGRVFSVS